MLTKIHIPLSILLMIAALLALCVEMGEAVYIYIQHAEQAIRYPYPLDYGEGPVLDQVLHLTRGEAIYRTSITTPPYTVTTSPPLFMLIQVPFAERVGLALWYGRAISIASLVLAAIFLGLTLYQLTQNPVASLIGSLLMLAMPYFVHLSVLDRVDTLALALSWGGLYILVRWPSRNLGTILAVLLFSAAIYTQQTYILVAPLTAVAWLALTRRFRRAIVLAAGIIATNVILFIGLNISTGGGLFYNLFTITTNPWNYPEVAGKLIELGLNTFFMGLIALTYLIGERLDVPTRSWPFVLPYFLCAFLVSALFGKTGPSDQSLYELAAALCLACGAAIDWMRNDWARAVLFVLLAIQVNGLVSWTKTSYLPEFTGQIDSQAEIAEMDQMIREADKPVLADEMMGLLPLAGKPVYYEPFEFNQLSQTGLWNPSAFLQEITDQKFSAIMIYFPSDFSITRSRWSDQFFRTIASAYDNTQTLAETLIYLPK